MLFAVKYVERHPQSCFPQSPWDSAGAYQEEPSWSLAAAGLRLYCSSSTVLGCGVFSTPARGIAFSACSANINWLADTLVIVIWRKERVGRKFCLGCGCSLEQPHLCPNTGEKGKQGFPPIVFRKCLHWLWRFLSRSSFLHFQLKSSFIAFPLGDHLS